MSSAFGQNFNDSPTSPTLQNQLPSKPSHSSLGRPSSRPSTPSNSLSPSNHRPGLDPPSGIAYRAFVSAWADEHVEVWLAEVKCAKHAPLFRSNDIRGDVILDLDQNALKEMGIATVGDRIKILSAVKTLRTKCSKAASAVAGAQAGLRGGGPRVVLNSGQHLEQAYTNGTTLTSPLGRSRSLRVNGEVPRTSSLQNPVRNDNVETVSVQRTNGSGRRIIPPPPLHLTHSASRGLPQVVNNSGSINGSSNQNVIPLNSAKSVQTPRPHAPQLQIPNQTNSSGGLSSRDNSGRQPLPPIPPAPRAHPPPPPASSVQQSTNNTSRQNRSQPSHTHGHSHSSSQTHLHPYSSNQSPAQAYANEQNRQAAEAGITYPGSAWSGEYGLPQRPSPGNVGGRLSPQPPSKRPNTARTQGGTGMERPSHQKSESLGAASSLNIAKGSSGTSGRSHRDMERSLTAPSAHPYASATGIPEPTSSGGLTVPHGGASHGLSPINEAFSAAPTPVPTNSGNSGRSYPGYSVGNGPFPKSVSPGAALSLEDLRRRIVRFTLGEGQNSRTIDISECRGGVDILEAALRKFGKSGSLGLGDPSGPNGDNAMEQLGYGEVEGGGLCVDGWGAFLEGPNGESTGKPLTETELLAICHSDSRDPARERLTLRRVHKIHNRKLVNFFGETPPPPGLQISPTSPIYTVRPKLTPKTDDSSKADTGMLGVSSGSPTARPGGGASRKMHRASTVSIMSGLGVGIKDMYGSPPTSPTGAALTGANSMGPMLPSADHVLSSGGAKSPSTASALMHTGRKLRNFFGQRPPSDIIYSHQQDFFPNAERKVLERTATARHSIFRGTSRNSKRISTMSGMGGTPTTGPGSAGDDNPWVKNRSRFSISSAGSALPPYAHAMSSPSKSSILTSGSAGKSSPLKAEGSRPRVSIEEPVPRMSVSTEDGQSIDLTSEDTDDDYAPPTAIPSQPQLLPPVDFSSETLTESLTADGLLPKPNSSPMSRQVSNASSLASNKRFSYLVELRSKRDKSDTASMLTLDEITQEVENKRKSWRDTVATETDGDSSTMVSNRRSMAASIRGSRSQHGDDEGDTEDETEEDPEATLRNSTQSEEVRKKEEDEYEDEEDEEEDEEEYEDDLEEEVVEEEEEPDDHGKAVTSTGAKRAIKWIKGALIGSGSFGSVYLGMDATQGLLMAVKQVELPKGVSQNEERKQSMLDALMREIELLKTFEHEYIVQYLDSAIDKNYLNIFLEYVPGGSVATLLKNYGAFEEALVATWVKQILTGLEYLHARGIIHRDIKGANILVDNKGGIKISDFGISKKVEGGILSSARSNRASLQGSVFWMAPEVVKQTGHTSKADIWSVGCLVVEMLTGEHPHPKLTQMQAIFRIGSSAKPTIPPDISSEAEDFLIKTFEIEHTERPSAADLLKHSWLTKNDTTLPVGGPATPSSAVAPIPPAKDR